MRRNGTLSRLVCTGVTLCFLLSLTVLGCSSQATPSPTTTPTKTTPPTATATAKPTPTSTPAPTGQPQYGGILRIAQTSETISLFPARANSALVLTLEGGPAGETLLRFDATSNTVPWLATAVASNVTAKTITLTLRKGVKFHDGTDFNAAAVKWNLEQFIAAKAAAAKLIASMDVVDDYTIRINLTAWDSTMISNFAQAAGMIVSPTATQANGVDWAAKNLVGTGPFKIDNWKLGVSITYNRFDGYWQQGKPYLDGVQFIFINNDNTREISLRAGELDASYALVSTDLPNLKGEGFNIVTHPTSPGGQTLLPDSANPKSPFADVRVRQAAAYALDNPTLVKAVYGDYGALVTNQLTWPGYWAYNPAVVGYPYNPAKAKQLLTAAGYPNGFQTKMMANSTNSQLLTYGTGMQSYLKAVGIDATIDLRTGVELNALALSGKTWEGFGTGRFSGDPDWISIMNSSFNGQGNYLSMTVPDDYSQAINNAVTAPDFATKQKFAQQVMQLAVDKYCLIIPEYTSLDSVTSWPYVHNTKLYDPPIGWTPEDAWMSKK